MMDKLQEIKILIDANNLDTALELLNSYLIENPKSDEAFYMRGKLFHRKGDWKSSINDYCEAIEINPNSPAVKAYEAAQEMLNFYHTDLYNP